MHIPDGFLSPPVWATLDVASAGCVAVVARRAQRDATDHRRIPLLGVMGAFVFAAQMINFPVGLGTSGHLVGGTLLAIVLGPSAAVMVMTAVLAVQAFVFQDGGIMVLGANVFNMALAGVAAGYLPYRLWVPAGETRWRRAAIFTAGLLSVLVSACLALTELLISGVRMPRRILAVSLALFAVSAILEGVITVAAIGAIERLRPLIVPGALAPAAGVIGPRAARSRLLGIASVTAVLLVVIGILAASVAPDGIEQLAMQLGIAAHSPSWVTAWTHTPLAGYDAAVPGPAWLRKAAAGLSGMLLIYALCLATGRLLSRDRRA